MTATPRAVVDVNVLVSAARTPNGLCGRLLEAAIDGRWRPVVSVDVLVSGDRDLLDLPDQRPPIETPAQFWRRLN